MNQGKITNTCDILCPYKLPVNHTKAVLASWGLRINKYCTTAVHIAPIAKPINANLDPFTLNFAINNVKIKLTHKAPANDPNGKMKSGAEGNSIIIETADKLAPLVIPITSGDANAFLTTP